MLMICGTHGAGLCMAITPGGLEEAIFLPIGRIRQPDLYLIPLAERPVLRTGSPANRKMQERL